MVSLISTQKDLELNVRYPGGLAWQVAAPKRVVRKSPPFKEFQKFLVGETEVVSPVRLSLLCVIDSCQRVI